MFADKTADGKIKVTLVEGKGVPAINDMTDLQIWDKVRLIIKAKIAHENNTQDEEEELPDN